MHRVRQQSKRQQVEGDAAYLVLGSTAVAAQLHTELVKLVVLLPAAEHHIPSAEHVQVANPIGGQFEQPRGLGPVEHLEPNEAPTNEPCAQFGNGDERATVCARVCTRAPPN